MTHTETISIVTEAISVALEKMAFLDAMLFEGECPEAPSSIVAAEINFSGPVSGTIRTLTGSDFARHLAENIGAVEELTEEQCVDAIKELVNVTCGLVLPMIASCEMDVFDLTVPHMSQLEECFHWDEFVKQPDVTVLDVEGEYVATRLIIND